MSKFDTHGGYFSPDNYIRINEGGTHDENPNGGVQMGVDPEGVPNMVEEDETVYDDYVFSDNITVDDAMVEKHNLPSWAKGKLYSKVTDRFVEEAEERPMDPISHSGLEEMLGRLRDAQEEQKQLQQERELEDELSQLSPEELDLLEAMLTPGTDQDGGVVGELGEQGLPPGAVVGPAGPVQQMPIEGMPMMRNGGTLLRKFDDGGWANFLSALNNYTVSRNPGGVSGTYRIDRRFPLAGFGDIKALEDSDAYRNFTDYVLTNSDNENVRNYLRALDAGTAPSVEKLFDGDTLKSNWRDLYNARRYDQKGGIYHFSGNDIATLPTLNPALPELEPVVITDPTAGEINGALLAPPVRIQQGVENEPVDMNYRLTNSPTDTTSGSATRNVSRSPYYSTFPRYAGALTAGALGLYNAAMPADEYTIPRINPVLPQGQLHLRDPRYNPLDEEQAVNTVLAANAGTNRQIMNSGLGPSVGATLLASDYNAGRNIGAARQAVWDANNQSRNAVTAAHNQNASALAGFDYGQSRDRAHILNDAAYRNAYNDLTRQRLNYEAEGQKYAAIQSSLDSIAQALSGIGQENAVLNALNSNTALYHWLSPNRVAAYKADTNESKDGGFLRKKKTKVEKEIEQQIRDLSEYGETLTKTERSERKKREMQQKIDNVWSPASPSELKNLFSGRKKKKN